MSRQLSGELLPEEAQELQALLAEDSGAQDRYKLMQQFWEQHDNIPQPMIEAALQRTLSQLDLPGAVSQPAEERPVRKYIVLKRMAIAAAVLAVIVSGFLLVRTMGGGKQTLLAGMVEKQNSKGVKSIIELTDGSKIWLNADSKIQYPRVFNGSTREVVLNGEAFFEVAKDPARPFTIHLANGTVRVLGTSFNIRAYDNEKIVETSVATGRVAFIPRYESGAKKQDTVFLSPDNKARYLFNKEELTTGPTISRDDRAWTEGRLIFKAMSFEDIGMQLERNFGKKVVFVTDNARSFRLTGSFQNNTLEDIMFYLRKSTEFNYKITETELLISDTSTALPE
ncbi:MAG: FecR domain-containing protein [Bacteroidetes bacterium]|nr:FecR domain-containing protein [Bacteroidota bacterium]